MSPRRRSAITLDTRKRKRQRSRGAVAALAAGVRWSGRGRQQARRRWLRANGWCWWCGDVPPLPKALLCADCSTPRGRYKCGACGGEHTARNRKCPKRDAGGAAPVGAGGQP